MRISPFAGWLADDKAHASVSAGWKLLSDLVVMPGARVRRTDLHL